jgi:cardiolipin synthase A/B
MFVAIWACGLYFAVRAVHDGRTSQGTLCWVVLLIVFPPLAIPFYFMFGDRRMEGYIRARRSGRRAIDGEYRKMLASVEHATLTPKAPELNVLSTLAGFPWTSDNTARLLNKGEELYDALDTEIAKARECVLMQFYIYRDDEVGQRVRAALCAAAKRGVRVYVMYDELGCSGVPAAYFQVMRDAGVLVSGFRTVPSRRRLLRLNFRNHRKLVVIDGAVSFFGGMNVGREYCGRDETIGEWRDAHVMSVGPAAEAAQMVFIEDWYWAQRNVPEGLPWRAWQRSQRDPQEEVAGMLMFPSGPTDDRDSGALMFLQIIGLAKRRLWLTTPYLVCEESVVQAIHLAKLRGVDVRFLIPERPDSRLVHHAAVSFAADLIAFKIPVYSYSKGFTHQKVIVCDDVASIGSANLDNRSMRLNFELTGVIADADFCEAVVKVLERDFQQATRLSETWWQDQGTWGRFRARLARLAGPLL